MNDIFRRRIGESMCGFARLLSVQCTGYNVPKGTIRFNGTLNGARVFQALGGPRVEYQELLAYSVNLPVYRLGDRISRWMTGWSKAMDGLSMKQLEVVHLMDSRLRVELGNRMRMARVLSRFDAVFPTLDKSFCVPDLIDQDVRAIHLAGAAWEATDLFAPFVEHAEMPVGYRDIWDATEDFIRERVWVGFIRFERMDGTILSPQPNRPVAWVRGRENEALPALWAVCFREAAHGHQP